MTLEHDVATHAGTSRRRAPRRALVLELLGSAVAVATLVSLPLHHLATRMTFFGDEAVVHAEDVRTYWVLVVVLLAGVVSSFAGGLWRRGRKAFVWHGLVAVVGLAASWGFSVTQSGPVSELDRDDRPLHSDVGDPDKEGAGACHSGGDSDECVGG